MTKDLTVGSPFKLIIKFAIPLLLGNLLQQAYNIADAMIVGKYLGSNELASVGASSSVQFLVLGFCIGLCCGFGIPIAQRFGAGDKDEMRNFVFHSMILTVCFAVVLTLVCVIECTNILHLLKTPDDIFKDAYIYLVIIFAGIPFSLLYNLMAAILRAVGDSKTPFIFLAISTVLNIALDLIFIMVLHWGCMGAAAATVTAQGVSGILCVVYMNRKFSVLHLSKTDCRIKGNNVRKMLVMGVPMGLQYSITAIGSMVMQSANNGLGSVYISGFTAAARIKQFAICPFDAFATAVSTFCSQNLGAGKVDRIKTGLRHGVIIGMSYGACMGLILIFAGRLLSGFFVRSDEVEVLNASAKYLKCLGMFMWAPGMLNVCRMTTQGLGFPYRALLSGAFEMAARIFVSLVFVPLYGFTAICFTDQSAWLSACFYIVPMCIFCVSRQQKKQKII